MYVYGYFEEDGYLHVDVDTIKAGIRPSDYANALSNMERELEKEGVEKVLLGCWHFENKLDVALDEDYFKNQGNFLGFSTIPDEIYKKKESQDTGFIKKSHVFDQTLPKKSIKEILVDAVEIDLSERSEEHTSE